jgi:hypothetical protein
MIGMMISVEDKTNFITGEFSGGSGWAQHLSTIEENYTEPLKAPGTQLPK